VLLFVAAKMALSDVVHVPIGLSLGVVAAILTGGVVISLLRAPRAGGAGRDRHAA